MSKTPAALVWGFVVVGLSGFAAAQQAANLTVNTDKVVKQLDVKLYGQFLEHIYHSLHGGLWGEVVWNRSFEESPPQAGGRRGGGGGGGGQPATPPPAGASPARHWTVIGSPEVTLDSEFALNSSKSLNIAASSPGQGIAQANFWVHAGDTLRGSLWMRSGDGLGGVTVRLVDGTKVLAEQTAVQTTRTEWKEFPLALTPSASANSATLQIISTARSTFWIDQVSLMPDSSKATGGYRPDLLKAVTDLKPGSIRWPGGSYVGTNGGYRWKGGIGPQSKRVGKVGWDELEPSAFGTDEFIDLCRKLGAEPNIVVYLGSRQAGADHTEQIQEAAEWVEYCNGPATSKWGAVRAANGHAEPYNVKYWEIDNEIWNMQPADYVRVVKEFSAAMKKVDPKIITIACGSGGYGARFAEGDMAVIADASDVVDYLSIHHYENSERFADGVGLFEAYVKKLGDAIDKTKNPNLKIYFSEWNVRRGIDWRSGLYAGGILNAMERDKYTTMACPALWLRSQTTGETWDNAFINFNHFDWFAAPNYVVMKLYRDHFEPNLLETTGDASGLNVAATKSADGKTLVLKVVNPTDKPQDAKFTLTGNFKPAKASLKLVAPDDLMAKNSFEHKDAVKVIDGKVEQSGQSIGISLPRWSVGVIEMNN